MLCQRDHCSPGPFSSNFGIYYLLSTQETHSLKFPPFICKAVSSHLRVKSFSTSQEDKQGRESSSGKVTASEGTFQDRRRPSQASFVEPQAGFEHTVLICLFPLIALLTQLLGAVPGPLLLAEDSKPPLLCSPMLPLYQPHAFLHRGNR